VCQVRGIRERQPFNIVGGRNGLCFDDSARRRLQPRHRRLHRLDAEKRRARGAFGRRHVALHQHRRERQHVGNVVEAIARIILREIVGGTQIDAE
jgi:hypothetical protein